MPLTFIFRSEADRDRAAGQLEAVGVGTVAIVQRPALDLEMKPGTVLLVALDIVRANGGDVFSGT